MRKHVFGRQFKRDSNQRKALFRSLIYSLILRGSIRTTKEKAKAISGDLDKIVTLAKKGGNSKNLLGPLLPKDAINKLILEIAPRFAKRHGGYTRIIKIGRRLSDNAQMAMIEWTEKEIKDLRQAADQPQAEKIQGLETEQKELKKPAGKKVMKSKVKNKEAKK